MSASAARRERVRDLFFWGGCIFTIIAGLGRGIVGPLLVYGVRWSLDGFQALAKDITSVHGLG